MSLVVQRVLVVCALVFGLAGAAMVPGGAGVLGGQVPVAAAHTVVADDDGGDDDGRTPRGGVETGHGGTAGEGSGIAGLLSLSAAAGLAGLAGVLFLRRGIRWHR